MGGYYEGPRVYRARWRRKYARGWPWGKVDLGPVGVSGCESQRSTLALYLPQMMRSAGAIVAEDMPIGPGNELEWLNGTQDISRGG